MLNKSGFILLFLILPIFLSAWGSQDYAEGDGQEYNIQGFTGIDASSSFKVEVRQSDRFSVVVYADASTRKKLLIEKKGDTLHLGFKPLSWGVKKSPRAVITLPVLESVDLSGASSMIASEFRSNRDFNCDLSGSSSLEIVIAAGDVQIDLSGASDLNAVLETDDLDIALSGSSDVDLTGFGKDLSADLSGASSADLKDFLVTKADIELSGSSDMHVYLDGPLSIDASGASNLFYTGNVELGRIELSGASSIEEK